MTKITIYMTNIFGGFTGFSFKGVEGKEMARILIVDDAKLCA